MPRSAVFPMLIHGLHAQPLEGLARGVQPAVEVVAAEMETVLYAQMLALFAPQVCTTPPSLLLELQLDIPWDARLPSGPGTLPC